MKQYRTILIGVGGIAAQHYKMLSAIPERCEVLGMVDRDAEMLEKRKAEWGYRAFGSLDEALAEKPDVAWVMTPVGPRLEILRRCFAAGCDVFTEKPLALNLEDAKACVAAAREAGRTLGFGCNFRHVPAYHTMARLFREGLLGDLIKVYAHTYVQRVDDFWARKMQQTDAWRLTFEASGGRIFEFSIHSVNWVQWIGGTPKSVFGRHDAVSPTLAEAGLDDVVSAHIGFERGFGVVETIMAPGVKNRNAFGIVGTRGEVWDDTAEGKVRLVMPEDGRDEFVPYDDAPTRAADFFDALDEGRAPLNDAEAALESTRICLAFNESVRRGECVGL